MSDVNTNIKVALPSTCNLIGIIFIICKLFGVISWSWWLVLLPFWGPVAVAFVLIIIAVAVAIVLDRD